MDEHCVEIHYSLLSLIALRDSLHCHRVRPVDAARGGAYRRSRGRRGRAFVRRQRKPDSLVESSLAQERADVLGWKQEAGGWITCPGHRTHEVTAGPSKDLLKYQPSAAPQYAPLLGHKLSPNTQKRPPANTLKAATEGLVEDRRLRFLRCGCGGDVRSAVALAVVNSPTPALEPNDVRVMKKSVQERAGFGGVAQDLSPVFDGAIG